jgi:hypothetical protein
MQVVEITVKGRIDESWSEWLADLTITHTESGETVLAGTLADQAALYGVLARLRDLGLHLVSLRHLEGGRRG